MADNKDLIQQYVTTGLKIPEKQLVQLSDNQKKSYYRTRLISINQTADKKFVMDYEYQLAPDEIKAQYLKMLPFDQFGNLVVEKPSGAMFNILKKDGTYLLDNWYDYIARTTKAVDKGYFYVHDNHDDLSNYIDKDGNFVSKNWFSSTYTLRDSSFVGVTNANRNDNIFDFTTGKLVFDKWLDGGIFNLNNTDAILVKDKNKENIFLDGKLIFDEWFNDINYVQQDKMLYIIGKGENNDNLKYNLLSVEDDNIRYLSDTWFDNMSERNDGNFFVGIKQGPDTLLTNSMNASGELLGKWEKIRITKR